MPLKQLQDILLGASIQIIRDSPLPSIQSPPKADKFMFKWKRKKDKGIEQFCKIIETKELGQDLKVSTNYDISGTMPLTDTFSPGWLSSILEPENITTLKLCCWKTIQFLTFKFVPLDLPYDRVKL